MFRLTAAATFPRRPSAPHAVTALVCALPALLCPPSARAEVAVLQPPAVVAADLPLRVTLMFSEDAGAHARRATRYEVPERIAVGLQRDTEAVRTVTLHEEDGPTTLRLLPGQFRKIVYSAPWPEDLRGTVHVQVAGYNTAPVLVTLDRGRRQAQTMADNERHADTPPEAAAAAPAPVATAAQVATGGQAAPLPTTAAVQPLPESRLSFYEPFYVGVGHNGSTTARFQLSFKYRIVTPSDPRSKGVLDNLYFGYTQTSIWDLGADSRPFRDTSYKPSLFYYLPDIGWRSRWFDSMGLQAGLEHESNGRAGGESRSINIAYVEPIVRFALPAATQLSVAPKLYYYLQKSENADIIAYRGYGDLNLKYGRPDGLQLATTLRKGNHAWNGSVDAQLSYPMQKLVGGAFGGYLWLGYFNGYGEDLLDYSGRQHWAVRIGYAIYR